MTPLTRPPEGSDDAIAQRLRELIDPARQRPGFIERLQRRIREDKSILDRLAASERDDHSCAPTPPSTAPELASIRERLKRRHDWGAVTVTMDVDEVRALLSALDEERRRGEEAEATLEARNREVDAVRDELEVLSERWGVAAETNMESQKRCLIEGHLNARYYEAKVECYGIGNAIFRRLATALTSPPSTTGAPE